MWPLLVTAPESIELGTPCEGNCRTFACGSVPARTYHSSQRLEYVHAENVVRVTTHKVEVAIRGIYDVHLNSNSGNGWNPEHKAIMCTAVCDTGGLYSSCMLGLIAC